MDAEKVALKRCDSYDRATVREAVEQAFGLLGGPESVVKPGEKVFVKSNCVIAASPESGIVTHAEVVRAVVEQLMGAGGLVVIGDSPGGPFTPAWLKRVYEKTGLAAVALETGAGLALDTGTTEVRFPGGKSLKRMTLCASMVEADKLVSVSKFKSHRYLNVTGPIKNLFGAVPGTTKFVYHSRFEDARRFADLVVDVHLAAGADFHVLDAVEGMEGNGARNGTVKRMGVIAAGRDAFALESLMLDLVGLKTQDDRTLAAAVARGVCPAGTAWLDVLGDDPEALRSSGFELPERNFFSERVPALVTGRLARLTEVTPLPKADRCNRCGKCVSVCPREAITLGADVAEVDPSKCIRCFCCDELCEQLAIDTRTPPIGRVINLIKRG